ncbi:Fc.00g115950.m01.CDS01 [Cosmosporella sp. VM-42]
MSMPKSDPRKGGDTEERREIEYAPDIIPAKIEHDDEPRHDMSSERKLLLKSDILILPLLILTYLIAYLDRNNIGNARLMTFQKDLHMPQDQFFSCVQIFYGGYLLGIFPGNIFIHKAHPNRLIGGGILFFGICVILLSIVRNTAAVLGLRFLIGTGEAVLQSSALYLSAWYKRDELATRIAIFYSAATLSGCFSGLIAYGIQTSMEAVGGRHAWQWLFIIEGSIALLIGLLVLILAPRFPEKIEKHWLFTKDELALAVQRFKSYNTTNAPVRWKQVGASLSDIHVWMIAFVNTANATVIAAVGAFLPSIMKEFGFSPVRTQLMTIIPYACAFVAVISIAYISDKFNKKAFFILGYLSSYATRLVILMATTNTGARIFAACLVVGGVYPSAVLQIAWVNINTCGHTKRAISYGLSQVLGQGFSMLASRVYVDPPQYLVGHGSLLAFVAWGIINCLAAYFWMNHQNRKRDKILEEYRTRGEDHPDIGKSFEELYDQHITFRYIA